jgi:hypothetical protein
LTRKNFFPPLVEKHSMKDSRARLPTVTDAADTGKAELSDFFHTKKADCRDELADAPDEAHGLTR